MPSDLHIVQPVICGNILRYIAYLILLTCDNVCDIDIAYSNIAYGDTVFREKFTV